MTDLKPAILLALASLPACTLEAYETGEDSLPLIVISDEERRVLARADGQDYLEEYTIAADIYAADQAAAETLCSQTDAALSEMGMKRISHAAGFDDKLYACHLRMLFRAVLRGETIYQ